MIAIMIGIVVSMNIYYIFNNYNSSNRIGSSSNGSSIYIKNDGKNKKKKKKQKFSIITLCNSNIGNIFYWMYKLFVIFRIIDSYFSV